jgi:hypothetical protein
MSERVVKYERNPTVPPPSKRVANYTTYDTLQMLATYSSPRYVVSRLSRLLLISPAESRSLPRGRLYKHGNSRRPGISERSV